jgi:hypothetical protein
LIALLAAWEGARRRACDSQYTIRFRTGTSLRLDRRLCPAIQDEH